MKYYLNGIERIEFENRFPRKIQEEAIEKITWTIDKKGKLKLLLLFILLIMLELN